MRTVWHGDCSMFRRCEPTNRDAVPVVSFFIERAQFVYFYLVPKAQFPFLLPYRGGPFPYLFPFPAGGGHNVIVFQHLYEGAQFACFFLISSAIIPPPSSFSSLLLLLLCSLLSLFGVSFLRGPLPYRNEQNG